MIEGESGWGAGWIRTVVLVAEQSISFQELPCPAKGLDLGAFDIELDQRDTGDSQVV